MVAPNLITETIRLNLGCGSDIRPGFVNVDKFPSSPEIVAADFPILPFEENFAHELLLSHVLEHFGYADGLLLCQEMLRVLKPGGIATIEVPDIGWCMAQFLGAPEPGDYTDPKGDYNTQHKWGLWAQAIWGDQHHDGLYHKWGYTVHRLIYTLGHAGFAAVNVEFVPSHGVQCLRATAQKASV